MTLVVLDTPAEVGVGVMATWAAEPATIVSDWEFDWRFVADTVMVGDPAFVSP